MDKNVVTEVRVDKIEHSFVRMAFVVTSDFNGVIAHVGRALVGKVGTIKSEGSVFVAVFVGVTVGVRAWALDQKVPSKG